MQIKALFKNGVQRLKQAGIPEPELEISLLLAHLLNVDRTALLLAGEQVLDEEQYGKFEKNKNEVLTRVKSLNDSYPLY